MILTHLDITFCSANAIYPRYVSFVELKNVKTEKADQDIDFLKIEIHNIVVLIMYTSYKKFMEEAIEPKQQILV